MNLAVWSLSHDTKYKWFTFTLYAYKLIYYLMCDGLVTYVLCEVFQ